MDEMSPFERQVADEVMEGMGPVLPFDDLAMFTAISTSAPRRRIQPLLDASRLVVAGFAVVLFGGLLFAAFLTNQQGDERLPAGVESSPTAFPTPTGPGPVTSPKESDVRLRTPIATALATVIAATPGAALAVDGEAGAGTPVAGLVTEVVEPGVALVIGDAAGHDLTVEKADDFKSVDQIAITPEGTVWVRSSISDSDDSESPGLSLFALGEEGIYTRGDGIPETAGHVFLHIAPDGTPLLIGDGPGQLFSFDGEQWIDFEGSRKIESDGRVLYLIDSADISFIVDEGAGGGEMTEPTVDALEADFGTIPLEWDDGWSLPPDVGSVFVEMPQGGEAGAGDGDEGILWFSGGSASTYLEGLEIHETVAAPDGSLWVLAEGENLRGELFTDLYRITNE